MLMATKIERYKICPFCKQFLQMVDFKQNEEIMRVLM